MCRSVSWADDDDETGVCAVKLVWRVLSAAMLVVCIGVVGVWTLGVVVSDRFLWSQYLSWLPSVVVLPVGAVLWVFAVVLARLGRRARDRRGKFGRRARMVVGLWVAVGVAWVLVWELRVYRLPMPPRPAGVHLRVLHWNITAIQRNEQITGPLLEQDADIAVMVNPSSHVKWAEIPAQAGEQYRFLTLGGFVVASKVPVVRWGMMFLGLEGLPAAMQAGLERRKIRVDPGRAMFLELDTKEKLGRNIVVWVLDMPSEPRLSRWAMAGSAAKALREWTGAVMAQGAVVPSEGLWGKGFPAADVVVGDFNIERGASSLAVLLPGMRNAFDEAGAGYAATWPRYGYRTPVPLVHIDQMFVRGGGGAKPATGGTVGVERYEVVDPGFGYHMMQVGDLVPGG